MSDSSVKSRVQQQFGQNAQAYVESKGHAQGTDLDRLPELAQPQADWLMLDVAPGGGHTALKFAPLVRRVVACDLTVPMLDAARTFVTAQGAHNLIYTAGDAENLPFANAIFDLVTCRIAPHHFPDCFKFVRECARVLRPGGMLLIQDHVLPEDDRAARYIDSFERLRDPSHHRAFAEYEWQGMFLDAGFTVEHAERVQKTGKLLPWAVRTSCTPNVIERLQILLAQAPEAVAAWIAPTCVGTPDATFEHNYIIIAGRK
jgi:ubiquinone/menaquinone biosynthesis C-methylase UbiE